MIQTTSYCHQLESQTSQLHLVRCNISLVAAMLFGSATCFQSSATGLEDDPPQIPKLQPTLVNIVAVVLCTLFLAGVVIMIAIFHRLKIKRYSDL